MMPLLLLLPACMEEWRSADIHIDVQDASWADTDRVRLCLDGVGVQEQALGAGRIAFTGVAVDTVGPLTIDTLDPMVGPIRQGRAGPVSLSLSEPWQSVSWAPCEGADCGLCDSDGQRVSEDASSWLIAVRFL